MQPLKILIYPDKRLLTPAHAIEAVDGAVRALAAQLLETMYVEDGVGLAATQVGIPLRMLAVDVTEEKQSGQVLINPVIAERTGEVLSSEGCLSFPDLYIEVKRAEKIVLTATSMEGAPIRIEADGLLARCLQHEVDHLDGVVFIDRLSPLKRSRAEKKFFKNLNEKERI
jgi:peptide deformylase